MYATRLSYERRAGWAPRVGGEAPEGPDLRPLRRCFLLPSFYDMYIYIYIYIHIYIYIYIYIIHTPTTHRKPRNRARLR